MKIRYDDYEKFTGESDLSQREAVDLFEQFGWKDGAHIVVNEDTDGQCLQFLYHEDALMTEVLFQNEAGEDLMYVKRMDDLKEGLQLLITYIENGKLSLDGFIQLDF